jgi:hypothetical protein
VLRRIDPHLVAWISASLGVLFFAMGLALALRLVLRLVPYEPNFTIDFDYYVLAGRSFLHGENPYEAAIEMHADMIAGGYVYPPLLAWALLPLSLALPVRLPYLLWVIAEIIGFGGSLLMVLRAGAQPVPWSRAILFVGAAFLPFVTWDNLYHGQVDFMLLVLVTVGVWLIARDRQIAGGVLLATAANVKPFLAILLFYLIWRCRWRATLAMGVAGAALLVLSFLPTLGQGTAVVTGWIEASRGMGVPPLSGHSFNHSIYGTLARLFTPTPYAVPWVESPALFGTLTLLFGLVTPTVWLLAVAPGPLRREADLLVLLAETSLLLTLMFAYGPIAEANHLLVLCAGLAATVRLAFGSVDPDRRRRWRLAAAAWVLFLIPTAGPLRQLTWTDQIAGVPEGWMVLLTGRVGALLLLVGLTTAWAVAREHRATSPHLSLRAALASGLGRRRQTPNAPAPDTIPMR